MNELGREIRRLRQRADLSQAELGKRVGVDSSYISMIETGRQPDPGRDLLRALSRELQTPIEELLRLAGYLPDRGTSAEAPRERTPQEIIHELETRTPLMVPLITQFVSAGGGSLVTERIPYFPAPEERRHDFVAVTVSGKCMEPAIMEGHIVIVDRDASPQPGDYVVAIQDDEALVKGLARRDGSLVLIDYHGEVIKQVTDDTNILGVVRAVHYVPPKLPSL